ncbi:MAG: CzcE family metal-binding protein [Betaproteobacteria bacterium]|nr:MAG: CzcE family metal-binding protein [Betaproteobacteria bacterium]TMH79914.1 MAG: CzcE family metal-binding protein [Betaproteobacteria bacterium]
MENYMKLLIPSIAALAFSAASLSAGAALKPSDLFGEPARAPSAERAIITAVPDRTIMITDETKWVNVNHFEVIRFVSNGREFTWYFDGVAQPRPFDLAQIAPAGFVGHSVTVYVSLSERDSPGG